MLSRVGVVFPRLHKSTIWILVGCVVFHATASAYLAGQMSATFNEHDRLMAGVGYWEWGTTAIFRVNPPLVHAIGGLPAVWAGAQAPKVDCIAIGAGNRPEFALGRQFCELNRDQLPWLLLLARIPCITFSLVGAVISFRWAADLYGRPAGLLAASCWCFCPSFVGHAATLGTDVPCATTALLGGWLFWRWLGSRSAVDAILCGMGCAMLVCTKFTGLALWALWCIVGAAATAWEWRHGSVRRQPCSRLMGMVLICATALLLINGIYGFSGSCERLADYRFASELFGGQMSSIVENRFRQTPFRDIPVPLPRDMVMGIDLQRLDFERGFPSYLRGEWASQGWWYYYLYALAIKMPLGMWMLVALAVGMSLRQWSVASGRWSASEKGTVPILFGTRFANPPNPAQVVLRDPRLRG